MTQNHQSFLYIPLFLAIPVYLIYIILSTKIFCISGITPRTGTLTLSGLRELLFIWVLPLCWLILLIACFFTPGGYISKYFFFGILIVIAILQILSVLFNEIRCFPASDNSFNYIQKIIAENPASLCKKDTVVSPWVSYSIYVWIRSAYCFANFILIILLISANKVPR